MTARDGSGIFCGVLVLRMRRPIEMPPRLTVLLVCAATLIGLVYAEGWTWPLRVAAVMIPVSYLIG
jgi:hypothetical protein